jgi:hypothetical protein
MIPTLDGTNYSQRSTQMLVFFEYQELLDIVNDGVPVLVENSTEENKIVHWANIKRDEKQALYFIQQGLPDDVFEKITNASTAKQAWDELKSTFNVEKNHRVSRAMSMSIRWTNYP